MQMKLMKMFSVDPEFVGKAGDVTTTLVDGRRFVEIEGVAREVVSATHSQIAQTTVFQHLEEGVSLVCLLAMHASVCLSQFGGRGRGLFLFFALFGSMSHFQASILRAAGPRAWLRRLGCLGQPTLGSTFLRHCPTNSRPPPS